MRGLFFVAALLLLGGCAAVPALPSEDVMPVQAILTRAVCELRGAFLNLKDVKGFHADQWAISISLTPKIDTDISAKLGYMGKSTINPMVLHYVTWTLGTAPGAEYDVRGHRDGSVSFLVHSSQLLDENRYPVLCYGDDPQIALMEHLGIGEWLSRLITTDAEGVARLTHLDKPTYNSQVIVKLDAGNVGPTFIGPYASVSPTLFGSHTRDESLSILMTPDPPKVKVVTLPQGAAITKERLGAPAPAFSPAVKNRLDQIQTETILRNLTIRSE